MKVVYLNVYESKKPEVLDIKDELQEFYRLIKCDTIDIVRRKIGEHYYDVICDDEGLYHEDCKISAINNLGAPMLVGNLIICDSEDGYEKSLTNEQVAEVISCIQRMYSMNCPQGYYVLTQCEF